MPTKAPVLFELWQCPACKKWNKENADKCARCCDPGEGNVERRNVWRKADEIGG